MRYLNIVRLFFLCLLAFCFSASSSFASEADSNKRGEPEFQQKIIEVLRAHGDEVLNIVREAAKKEAVSKKMASLDFEDRKQVDTDNILFGSKNSPIRIVEYMSFRCPHCKRAKGEIEEIVRNYGKDVCVSVKPVPHSKTGKRIAYLYEMFLEEGETENARILYSIAMKDPKIFQDNMDKVVKKITKDKKEIDWNREDIWHEVENNQKEADRIGLRGTPTFLVNGVMVAGYVDSNFLKKVINKLN